MKQVIGIATTTCPNEKTANSIVGSLLTEDLIACGQVEGPMETNYKWNGKLVREKEWRVTIKFAPKKRKDVETRILSCTLIKYRNGYVGKLLQVNCIVNGYMTQSK